MNPALRAPRGTAIRSRRFVVPGTMYAAPAYAAAPFALPTPFAAPTGRHPLADNVTSLALRRRADEIASAFGAIEPTLRALAPGQFEPGFVGRAAAEIRSRLGIEVRPALLSASWATPLDMRALYADCVLATFCRLIEGGAAKAHGFEDGEDAATVIQRWGFHAVDITPCADGRLSGVTDFILRVPAAVIAFREAHAGAMFDVTHSLRHWEMVELRRYRESVPNDAAAPTRFLKLGVYHFSSADPSHEGCAAHGSDAGRAAAALLERLEQFAQGVRAVYGAQAAILLAGVDTDTDAIRVHVPDARGRMTPDRYTDSLALYDATRDLPREAGKDAIRDAVAACAGVAPDDAATQGMRWFCGYLLKNNLAQVDAVRDWHGGRYADAGHTERLIVVGEAVNDVQLRNLAFQAEMATVEEGAADLDIGMKILRASHGPLGLAVPVLVHFGYDHRIPGAEDAARERARRLAGAVRARHAGGGPLHVRAVVRATDGSAISEVGQ